MDGDRHEKMMIHMRTGKILGAEVDYICQKEKY